MKKLFAALVLVMSATSWAGDFENGLAAFNEGDYSKAGLLLQSAAAQGNPRAMYVLAYMFNNGLGMTRNPNKAQYWFTMSAERGDAYSQYSLGRMYEEGDGVQKNYKKAISWYKLAADQGHAEAQFRLADLYHMGQGTLQDNVMAHMWTNLSAAQGYDDAPAFREYLAKLMTPKQIAEARDLARKCLARNYKGCNR